MSEQLAVSTPRSGQLVKASSELSSLLGMEVPQMLSALKAQCFKGSNPDAISNEQLAAFVSVANHLRVNPLLPGFLYAYPTKNGGIEPIAGPDTIFKKLEEAIAGGVIDGYDCIVYPEDPALPPTHATCVIERGNGRKAARYTAIKAEWYVESNPNWKFKTRHMLWLRAIKQCARQVIHGLPMDSDEYKLAQMQNVTELGDAPEAPVVQANVTVEEPPARAAAPKRNPKGAAAVVENAAKVVEAQVVEEKPKAEAKAEPAKPEPKPAEPVVEQKPEPKPEPKADPKPAEAPPAATEQPTRAMLKDGEVITVKATVSSLTTLLINQKNEAGNPVQTPSIQCKLSGGFIGTVIHIGGGSAKDGNTEDLVANPPWRNGASVTVTLRGRLQPKTGKVVVLVESVKAAEAVPATDLE